MDTTPHPTFSRTVDRYGPAGLIPATLSAASLSSLVAAIGLSGWAWDITVRIGLLAGQLAIIASICGFLGTLAIHRRLHERGRDVRAILILDGSLVLLWAVLVTMAGLAFT